MVHDIGFLYRKVKFVKYFSSCAEFVCSCLQAANYLDINGLLNLTMKRVADKMRGKTLEQVREEFKIVN